MGLDEFDKSIKQLIKHYKLTNFEEEIFKISKKAMAVFAKEQDQFNEVSNTRFGGQPDIYPELEKWLIKKEKKGKQPVFLCQINLKDISEYQSLLPKQGILYFFGYGVKYYKGKISKLRKISEQEKNLWIAPLATKYDNTDAAVPFKVEFELIRTLPQWDTQIFHESIIYENYEVEDKYMKLIRRLEKKFQDRSRYIGTIFGHYGWEGTISENIMAELNCNYNEMVTLLSLISDNNVNYMFSDAGEAACCVKLEDLLKLKFNKSIWGSASS